MKKFIIICLLSAQVALQAQTLWVEKTKHDFGKVELWNNPPLEIKVTNQSEKPLTFLPIFYNQEYQVGFSSKQLQPGESGTININYYTESKGKFEKNIIVYHSLSGEPITFNIKGYISSFDPEALTVCPSVNSGPTIKENKIIVEVRDFDTDGIINAERITMESINGRKIKLYGAGKGYEAVISTGQYKINAYEPGYEKYDARVDLATYQKKFIVYLVKQAPVAIIEPPLPEKPPIYIEEPAVYPPERIRFEDPPIRPKIPIVEPILIDTASVEHKHNEEPPTEEVMPKTDTPRTKELDVKIYKFNNIILVADISTSMKYNGKLEYLNSSVNKLIEVLRPADQVGMISLASSANIIHAPGYVTNKDSLQSILSGLKIGGATNGGSALEMAYKMAEEHFVIDGNNQIIIATDGTFTGGTMSRSAMFKMIEEKAANGIHLSTIGLLPNENGINFLTDIAALGQGNFIHIYGQTDAEEQLREAIKLQSKK